MSRLLIGSLITASVLLITIQATIGQPTLVKSWLAGSGTYEQIIDILIPVGMEQEAASGLSVTNVTSSLKEAFSPDFLQPQTEKAIDSAYSWLNGSSPTLQFSIDTPERRRVFEASLSAKLLSNIKNTTECSDPSTPAVEFALCSSVGSEAGKIAQETASHIASQIDTFDKPITQDSFGGKLGTDLRLYGLAVDLPFLWQHISLFIVISIIGIGLCLGVIALLATNKLSAFNRLARSLFFTNLILGIFTGVAFYLSSSLDSTSEANTAVVPAFLIKLAAFAVNDITNVLLYIYLTLSVVLFTAWMLLRRKLRAQSAPVETTANVDSGILTTNTAGQTTTVVTSDQTKLPPQL